MVSVVVPPSNQQRMSCSLYCSTTMSLYLYFGHFKNNLIILPFLYAFHCQKICHTHLYTCKQWSCFMLHDLYMYMHVHVIVYMYMYICVCVLAPVQTSLDSIRPCRLRWRHEYSFWRHRSGDFRRH